MTIKQIVSGNLFLLKATRKEKLSSNSLRETLGRRLSIALRLLCLNLLQSKMVLLKVVLTDLAVSLTMTLNMYRAVLLDVSYVSLNVV